MKCLSFVIVLLFTFTVSGQTEENCPEVKYKRNGAISSVTKINSSYTEDFTCRIVTITGKITGLGYDTDESEEVTSITIQNKSGQRDVIHFGEESLLDCFSEAEKRNWKSQIKKGSNVSVGVYACGASGNSDLSIASISFVIRNSNKKNK